MIGKCVIILGLVFPCNIGASLLAAPAAKETSKVTIYSEAEMQALLRGVGGPYWTPTKEDVMKSIAAIREKLEGSSLPAHPLKKRFDAYTSAVTGWQTPTGEKFIEVLGSNNWKEERKLPLTVVGLDEIHWFRARYFPSSKRVVVLIPTKVAPPLMPILGYLSV